MLISLLLGGVIMTVLTFYAGNNRTKVNRFKRQASGLLDIAIMLFLLILVIIYGR